jgi:threonylcarbamoyladenosine tRNA methylthiotransferase MtaB
VGVWRLVSVPVKVSFQTFGCKANQYDTELLRTRLESGGGESVEDFREADLCLVNSCSVTAKADQECRQFVRRLLRENPLARIVVTGCYASHAPEDLKALSPRVEVYSNKDKEGLPACLGFEVAPEVWGLSRFAHRARAFVKIQDGCKAPCRYCIIPQTRSAYWSKPVDHVLNEVQTLVAGGHGEIVFTGIRLGLYHGKSSDGKGADLTNLLARIIDLPGRFRIRLSSLEVTEIPDKLIQLAAGTDKICAHFHIPLQSAEDGVLKDMGRWYRFADYADRVSAVRRFLPEAAVTADVLTGFPTESEAAFEETFRRIDSLNLSGLHAFPYSSRPGTVSADLKPLDRAVLQKRTRRLIDLSDSLKARFQARFVGTRRTALAEGNGEGWTDNYLRVTLPPDVPAGALVLAQI